MELGGHSKPSRSSSKGISRASPQSLASSGEFSSYWNQHHHQRYPKHHHHYHNHQQFNSLSSTPIPSSSSLLTPLNQTGMMSSNKLPSSSSVTSGDPCRNQMSSTKIVCTSILFSVVGFIILMVIYDLYKGRGGGNHLTVVHHHTNKYHGSNMICIHNIYRNRRSR